MTLEDIFIENYKNFLPSLFSIGFRIFSNEDGEIILKNDRDLRIVIQINRQTNGIKIYFIDENGESKQPFYPSGNKSIFFPSVFFECFAEFLQNRGYISCEYNSISQTFKYNSVEIDVSDENMKGEVSNEKKSNKLLIETTNNDKIDEILNHITISSIENIITNESYNMKKKNERIKQILKLVNDLEKEIKIKGEK